MSKIKGWRKIKDTKRVFRYRSVTGSYVFGGKYHRRQAWHILGKTFRTKKQAREYAIMWMRGHPWG